MVCSLCSCLFLQGGQPCRFNSSDTIILGQFQWEGGDFQSSAEDISFELEGDDNVPILRATLMDVEGEGQSADINLSERIGNDNGNLVFN